MKASSNLPRHLSCLGRRAACAAGMVLGAFGLGACSGPFSSAAVVSLGTPRLTPAEVVIAANATSASAAVQVQVELPYRYINEQDNPKGGTITLTRVSSMPAGLQLQSRSGDPDEELASEGTLPPDATGLTVVTVAVRVLSSSGIGQFSPGRHTVQLRAKLCVEGIIDLSVDETGPVCDAKTVDLVIVVGGAALPAAPADLAATPAARNVVLRWSSDPAPDGYLLERALGSGTFATVATLTAPVNQHLDGGLDPGTRYTYRLTPRNAAGNGPAAAIEVQTLAEASNGQVGAAVSGTGTGRVSSLPAGIDCPGDCNETFALGSTVTLTATPAVGSEFAGWSGPADCADGIITVVVEVACTASFTLATPGARGWALIGELLASGGEAPVVAPPRGDALHVALRRVDSTSGFRELVVMRESGPSSWTVLGGGAPNGIASATSHGLVLDGEGRPYVAWTEATAVRVARFENGVWTRLANNLRIGNGTPSQVQLEWRDLQPPVLSWIETDGGVSRVAVKRLALDPQFGDRAWFGGFLPDVPNLVSHRMALDSNGLPSIVVSRLNVSLPLPLAAWRVTSIADGAVQAEAVGSDLTIGTGIGYQHDQLGYGIGLVLNFDSTSGAPVVLGTRDARWAYAKASNGTSWIQAGRVDNVLSADGLVLDANPANGESVLGVTTMRTPSVGLLLGVLTASGQVPDRIELLSLDGLTWIRPTDPLFVPQLSAIGSGILDAADRPVVLTVEGFGAGGRGRIRAYRWTP